MAASRRRQTRPPSYWATNTARALTLVGALVGFPSCALVADVQNAALLRPTLVDDHPAARVRVFYAGALCRIEVVLPTATLVTALTTCTAIPMRTTP